MIHETTNDRDMRFDALRVAAMLMIIACHFVSNIGWRLESPDAPLLGAPAMAADQLLGQVGSSLFFLITGYFLVNRPFRVRRIVDTVLQTFLYSTLFLLLQAMLLAVHPTPGIEAMFAADRLPATLYGTLLPVFNGAYWFITAYVLMLAVSPYLNMVLAASRRRSLVLVGLLLGVSLMALLSMTQPFWNNWCYAITGYLAGGWIRLYGKDSRVCRKLRWWHVGVAASVAYGVLMAFDYAAVALGFMDWLKSDARYVTGMIPALSIGVAAMIFAMMATSAPRVVRESSRRESGLLGGSGWRGGRGGRFGILASGKTLSATVFGVYLIHNNPYVRPNLWAAVTAVLPAPGSFAAGLAMGAVVTAGIFIVCAACAVVYDAVVVRPVQRLAGRLLRLQR